MEYCCMKGWNTVVLVYTVQYVTAGDHMISTLLYAVLYNDKYVLAYFFLTFCDHIFTSCNPFFFLIQSERMENNLNKSIYYTSNSK